MFEQSDLLCFPSLLFGKEQLGEQGGIVENDAVGNQPTALAPELLVRLRFEAQLAEVGVVSGSECATRDRIKE